MAGFSVLMLLALASPYVGWGREDAFFLFELVGLRRSDTIIVSAVAIVVFGFCILVEQAAQQLTDRLARWSMNLPPIIYAVMLMIIGMVKFVFSEKKTAFEWTTLQDIPPLLRLINPEFLQNDLLTVASIDTPKEVFQHILRLPTLIGLDWESGLYFYKVFIISLSMPCLFLCLLSVLRNVIPSVREVRSEGALRIFLFFIIGSGIITVQGEPAGWPSVYSIMRVTAYSFSVFLGMGYLALAFCKGRIYQVFSIATLIGAVFVHPAVGIQFFALRVVFSSLPLIYGDKDHIIKRLSAEVFLGLLLPLSLILIRYSGGDTLDAETFIHYYVLTRHPHHYQMSHAIGITFVVWMLLYLLMVIVSWRWAQKLVPFTLLCFFYYTIPILVQYVGTEVVPIKAIATLGPSRFTYFASVLWWGQIIVMLWQLEMPKRVKIILNDRLHTTPSIFMEKVLGAFDQLVESTCRLRLLLVLVALLGAGGIWHVTQEHPLDRTYYEGEESAREVVEWIQESTSKNAVFFVRDLYYSFFIRVYGERASFVDTAMPFNETYFAEYFSRLKLYDTSVKFGPKEYLEAAQKYGLTHLLIRNTGANDFTNRVPDYKSRDWAIYSLSENTIQPSTIK
jgi:hypothetical protein